MNAFARCQEARDYSFPPEYDPEPVAVDYDDREELDEAWREWARRNPKKAEQYREV